MKIDETSVISFEEYQNPELNFNQNWKSYWEYILEPLYEIEYWKLIKQFNSKDLIDDIFDRFDFETVQRYMESVNWRWQDNEKTPTIKELKSAVLSLIGSIFESETYYEHNPSWCESGGFRVSVFNINNRPFKIKVEFKKQDGTKIEEGTKLTLIRKKKLDAINKL